jgi:hypothetical protein
MNRQMGAYLKYSLLFAMLLAGGAISRAAAQVTSFTYQAGFRTAALTRTATMIFSSRSGIR